MKHIESLLSAALFAGFIGVTGTALGQDGALSKQEGHPSLKVKVQAMSSTSMGRMTSLPPETTKSSRKDLTKSIGSPILTRDERGVDGMREEVIRLLIASLYV